MVPAFTGARILDQPRVIIRKREVERRTGLSYVTLWRKPPGEFPESIRLGPQAVGWFADEVDEWVRTRARGKGQAPKRAEGIVNLTGCSQRDAHREGRALMIMPL
jgi:predicted DNA-binding transcriptional regulator AlpA